jgi:hypothetical protein
MTQFLRSDDATFLAVAWPTFFYWLRAGVALALGAGVVYVAFVVGWILLLSQVPTLGALRLLRLI